jgi:iron(III) transport system permease protein
MGQAPGAGGAHQKPFLSEFLGGRSPLVLGLTVLLLILVIPPVIYLVVTSFFTTDFRGAFVEPTVEYYTSMVGNPRLLKNIINTTVYSVGSSIIAIVVGVSLSWIVERTNTPGRSWMMLVAIVSLGTPHILYTIAWLLILGKAGPVNEILQFMFGEGVKFNVYSMTGMILVEGFTWTSLAFLLMSAVMRSADASLEEASMMSGASHSPTFFYITLKLAVPGILALMLLIFIRTFESFEVPAVVGMPGGISVMTTDIYEGVHLSVPARYGESASFAMVLLLIVIVLLYYYNKLSRYAERYQTITGKGFRPRILNLGKWRYLTSATLLTFIFLIIIMPVGIVTWTAFLPYYDGINMESLGRVTLDNFRDVADADSFRESIVNTIIMGGGAAISVGALTALCGWLVVRRYKGAWLLDQLATLPLVFPAVVLGVAFLQIFLNTPFGLYGTLTSLVIAALVHYMPYGMRYAYAGALQISSELEEASTISGARDLMTFRRVVIPLLLPPIITSCLLIFLLAVRAVSMPILLVGPDSQVVAVTLFDLWNNGQINELAAMGVTWMAMMTCVSIIFYVVSRRYGLSVH